MFCVAAWLCALTPSHAEVCRASWYGYESGRFTASGERFNPHGLSAASWKHPFGTGLLISYAGRSVVVRINDRGPARWTGRCLDLSEGAARAIHLPGAATISIRRLN